jgi:hypothetical protein
MLLWEMHRVRAVVVFVGLQRLAHTSRGRETLPSATPARQPASQRRAIRPVTGGR